MILNLLYESGLDVTWVDLERVSQQCSRTVVLSVPASRFSRIVFF